MDEKTINSIVDTVVDSIKPQTDMTLSAARRLSEKVREKAREMGVNAVVAISNKGANPVMVECMDDSFIASYDIAFGKAYTVVSLKMSTSKLKKLAEPGGSLYGIQFTNGGKIVIFGGGEPLYNKKGELIGGLGVSGGTEAQDTALAEYGKKVFESRSF
ncbi:MAG: heme-binding protein [Clostridia bacterium]|nr:heme-binding protein [Clostridia bacterium]